MSGNMVAFMQELHLRHIFDAQKELLLRVRSCFRDLGNRAYELRESRDYKWHANYEKCTQEHDRVSGLQV
jgi:hypothetical protein